MFERYSESARRALFFARYAASELGGVAIETEHMLLGLLRVSQLRESGIVARILALAQVSAESLRRELEGRSVFREKVAPSVEMPFSAATQRALTFAAEEADRLTHNYIGTEHLFLGLLRDDSSVAGSLLTARGLRSDDVRNTVMKLLAESPASSASSAVADLHERIDEISQMVEQLVGLRAHSSEAYALADRIRDGLEDLKRRLAE